jgi:hypothetical protein
MDVSLVWISDISFKRLGFPEFWSDIFTYDDIFTRSLTEELPFTILYGIEGTPKMYSHALSPEKKDEIFSEGFSTYKEYLSTYYTWRELSMAHMEFLFEIINLVKYNLAVYNVVDRSSDYFRDWYNLTLQENTNDSEFISELNYICRQLPHARDDSPLIDYMGGIYYGLQGWQYSDSEFRSMTNNIRKHIIAKELWMEENGFISSSQVATIHQELQETFPYWNIEELFPSYSINFPKGFK